MYEHLNVTIRQAIPILISAIKANTPALLWGSYGLGKSALLKQLAAALKFDDVVTIVPSQKSVIDCFLPYLREPDEHGVRKSASALSDLFPTTGRYLLHVEEINTAPPDISPMLYSVILDNMIGEHRLPDSVRRVASANRVTDKAAARPMPSALRNRFPIHLNLIPDQESWINWGLRPENDISPELIAFVREYPDALDASDPDDVCGGCTPRGLEGLSKLLKAGIPDETATVVYYGSIGQAMGSKFAAFLELYRSQISAEDILRHPDTAPVPTDNSAAFCVVSALVHRANEKTLKAIYTYGQRLHASLLVLLMRDIFRKQPELQASEVCADFVLKNADLVR